MASSILEERRSAVLEFDSGKAVGETVVSMVSFKSTTLLIGEVSKVGNIDKVCAISTELAGQGH